MIDCASDHISRKPPLPSGEDRLICSKEELNCYQGDDRWKPFDVGAVKRLDLLVFRQYGLPAAVVWLIGTNPSELLLCHSLSHLPAALSFSIRPCDDKQQGSNS